MKVYIDKFSAKTERNVMRYADWNVKENSKNKWFISVEENERFQW